MVGTGLDVMGIMDAIDLIDGKIILCRMSDTGYDIDTTIPIDPDVRDRLRGLKVGRETYTEVIVRLMETKEQYDRVFEEEAADGVDQ